MKTTLATRVRLLRLDADDLESRAARLHAHGCPVNGPSITTLLLRAVGKRVEADRLAALRTNLMRRRSYR